MTDYLASVSEARRAEQYRRAYLRTRAACRVSWRQFDVAARKLTRDESPRALWLAARRLWHALHGRGDRLAREAAAAMVDEDDDAAFGRLGGE